MPIAEHQLHAVPLRGNPLHTHIVAYQADRAGQARRTAL
jgi:hypothetical protein